MAWRQEAARLPFELLTAGSKASFAQAGNLHSVVLLSKEARQAGSREKAQACAGSRPGRLDGPVLVLTAHDLHGPECSHRPSIITCFPPSSAPFSHHPAKKSFRPVAGRSVDRIFAAISCGQASSFGKLSQPQALWPCHTAFGEFVEITVCVPARP